MFKDKNILILGGTGTIGKALVKRLLLEKPKVIRIFSRDELKQFEMSQEFGEYKNIRYLIGDIREYHRVLRAMEGIDFVFHVAALKQVPACEYNPFEAVKTNVLGTQNVIDAAMAAGVKKVIFTSSDKTICPTNTYGATKLLAERLVSNADYYKGAKGTIYAAVRFGNVMGSRGSVIPIFKEQILKKRYITLTEPKMTRFMMTQEQAVELLLRTCGRAMGGEIFVLKMPVVKMQDLAEVVIEEVGKKYGIDKEKIEIKEIGIRPGEKMFEELMTLDESNFAIEFEDMFAVQPVFEDKHYNYNNGKRVENRTYSSLESDILEKEEIRSLILGADII